MDFEAGPYIVDIPKGATRVAVSVPIIDDAWYEGTEHFTARIETNSSSGITPGSRDEAAITISDSDCECHSAGRCREVILWQRFCAYWSTVWEVERLDL